MVSECRGVPLEDGREDLGAVGGAREDGGGWRKKCWRRKKRWGKGKGDVEAF